MGKGFTQRCQKRAFLAGLGVKKSSGAWPWSLQRSLLTGGLLEILLKEDKKFAHVGPTLSCRTIHTTTNGPTTSERLWTPSRSSKGRSLLTALLYIRVGVLPHPVLHSLFIRPIGAQQRNAIARPQASPTLHPDVLCLFVCVRLI